ncbi:MULTISPECIES: hypothetical protein [unclassified Pseudomonas]|jgi:hypothetical protein|uniref:hypothetical protein n=1 Tax=unclassified Pseudomonas TaxID=196821 RepID=UPI000C86E0D4|nr:MULTISPECIES: hypothetical protein [unclassified Pseudomonas]PMU12854.1 hypothetical protein C1X90_34650 [Pseudomonas sp. GP01-A9]PMU14153.1 hypothetical protein C1X88_34625 [Pseudomonas sp. GP01-A13]PMU37346.1 hypothetical protein C1X87_33915 [Pseudomonas sp. GP01-A14]PMU38840.1 hypothetical protein C1X89_15455 [Pseudomonas sp. GP01-A8]PMU46126.1 hypothetical protein C1X85_34665 [Pseudomonas sp. GP01-A6]
MAVHRVIWEMDVDVTGGPLAAAQAVAKQYFAKHVANGEPGSACVFTVIDPKGKRALVDLAPSLSDLEGDDTE